MSKKILSLIMVFALLAGILLVPGIVPEAKAAGTVYYENDFENGSTTAIISGSIAQSETSDNHYLTFATGSGGMLLNYSQNFVTTGAAVLALELDVAFGENAVFKIRAFNQTAMDNGSATLDYFFNSGLTELPTKAVEKIQNGEYVKIALYMDQINEKYAAWVEGELFSSGTVAGGDFLLKYLKFEAYNSQVKVDNLKVYELTTNVEKYTSTVYVNDGNATQPYWSATSGWGVWNYGTVDNWPNNLSVVDSVVFEMKLKLQSNGSLGIQLWNSSNSASNSPNITISSLAAPASIKSKFDNNEAVLVSLVINQKETVRTYSVYYDGILVKTGALHSSFFIGYYRYNWLAGSVTIENLKVYSGEAPLCVAGTPDGFTYFDRDFEDKNTNGFNFTNSALVSDEDNNYLKMTSTTSGAKILVNYDGMKTASQIVIQMDIASTALGTTHFKVIGTGGQVTAFVLNAGGNITSSGGAILEKISTTGKYVNVAVALDMVNNKHSVWIEGVKVVSDASATIGAFNYLQIEMTGSNCNAFIDNIKLYKATSPVFSGSLKLPVINDLYLNKNFENDCHGMSLLNGGTHNNTNEVQGDALNRYVYMSRNEGSADMAKIYASVAGSVNSDYVLVSVDIASEEFNDIRVKVVGASNSFYAVRVLNSGELHSDGATAMSEKLNADGKFINFTIMLDSANNVYSLFVDGVQILSNKAKNIGEFRYVQIEQVGTTGHAMIDNLIIGSYKPVKFSAAAPVLENNLAINFKADATLFAEDCYSDPYATFTFKDETVTVTDYEVVDGKYVFKFNNIAPHQMGDEITYTISATYNGEVVSSPEKTYSILKYCQSTLADANAADKVKTLVTDLLNYGAAAQTYMKYNTDALVNTGIDQTLATAERNYGSVLAKGTEIADPTVDWTGSTLILESAITVRLKFTATSVEGLTVKINGQTVEPVSAGNNQWYVFYNGLNAGQLSTTIIAQIFNGDTAVSNTLTYSVESYANYQITNSTDANLVDLVKAMMIYGDSAANYR